MPEYIKHFNSSKWSHKGPVIVIVFKKPKS